MGARFSTPVHTSRESTYSSVQWLKDLFPGSKVVVAWPLSPTPSSAEVQERVELHFHSPLDFQDIF
jgi:hypothetical protein